MQADPPTLAAGVRRAALAFSVLPTPHADALAHLLTHARAGPAARGPDAGARRLRRRAHRGPARARASDPSRRRLADPLGAQPFGLPVPRRRGASARTGRGGARSARGERQPISVAVALVPPADRHPQRSVGTPREPAAGEGDAATPRGRARRHRADPHPRPRALRRDSRARRRSRRRARSADRRTVLRSSLPDSGFAPRLGSQGGTASEPRPSPHPRSNHGIRPASRLARRAAPGIREQRAPRAHVARRRRGRRRARRSAARGSRAPRPTAPRRRRPPRVPRYRRPVNRPIPRRCRTDPARRCSPAPRPRR